MRTMLRARPSSRPRGRLGTILLTLFLPGCSEGVLDPKGPIAAAERLVLFNATTTMLAVVIPVIVLTAAFAWWFRAGNDRATYKPDWSYSGSLELVIWAVPALVVTFLGGMAWVATHELDPPKPIVSSVRPVEIQVVSLDWKWLFIYPEQDIASINQLVIPVGTPIRLHLTSASVMNSFFIPQLAGQLYTMHGMETRLNLLAADPGKYQGLSSQFSGDGFSDMRFTVDAVSATEFTRWVTSTKGTARGLDAASYVALVKPSSALPASLFGKVRPKLFEAIVSNALPAGTGPIVGNPTPDISPRERH